MVLLYSRQKRKLSLLVNLPRIGVEDNLGCNILKIVAVIPARYDSTRLAGKVLLKDTGKYLIQHTYEQVCCAKMPDEIILAVDDEKVLQVCAEFGAKAVLTSKDHQSGTDRIAQAVRDIDADIIINVQADEPEIDPESIDLLASLIAEDSNCDMATLIAGFDEPSQIENPDIVKCITDNNNYAIYFSRLPLPYCRDNAGLGDLNSYSRHLGIYAYRKSFLKKFTAIPQSKLEKLEKLEQLRAIENGYKILTGRVAHHCDGIDTKQQYESFVKRYKEKHFKMEF